MKIISIISEPTMKQIGTIELKAEGAERLQLERGIYPIIWMDEFGGVEFLGDENSHYAMRGEFIIHDVPTIEGGEVINHSLARLVARERTEPPDESALVNYLWSGQGLT